MMIIMSPPMVINCYYETWVLGNINLYPIYIIARLPRLNIYYLIKGPKSNSLLFNRRSLRIYEQLQLYNMYYILVFI